MSVAVKVATIGAVSVEIVGLAPGATHAVLAAMTADHVRVDLPAQGAGLARIAQGKGAEIAHSVRDPAVAGVIGARMLEDPVATTAARTARSRRR